MGGRHSPDILCILQLYFVESTTWNGKLIEPYYLTFYKFVLPSDEKIECTTLCLMRSSAKSFS